MNIEYRMEIGGCARPSPVIKGDRCKPVTGD